MPSEEESAKFDEVAGKFRTRPGEASTGFDASGKRAADILSVDELRT